MRKFFSKLKEHLNITEVAIAIAIILIITVGSFTTITLSTKKQRKNFIYQDINFTCTTVIDCFRFDGDLSILSTIYGDKYSQSEHSINRNTYTLYLSVNGNKITISAIDKNDNELYKVNYER